MFLSTLAPHLYQPPVWHPTPSRATYGHSETHPDRSSGVVWASLDMHGWFGPYEAQRKPKSAAPAQKPTPGGNALTKPLAQAASEMQVKRCGDKSMPTAPSAHVVDVFSFKPY